MFVRSSLCAVALCAASAFVTVPASAADGRTGAFLGGAAVGAVGGVLLGQALAPRPAPRPAPVVYDPYYDQLSSLHAGCDRGSRLACIRFGEFLGAHHEREAEWRRTHPDFFRWDGY
jgi:hypothetical protein